MNPLNEKIKCNHIIDISYYSGSNIRKLKHSKKEMELTKVVKIDQKCKLSQILIFVDWAAHSRGLYFFKRQTTRETWVSDAIENNITVIFVIAEPKDNKTQK
jgi:hypothetical protein